VNRARLFIGALYRTYASWQRFGDKENRGETGAGMIGLLVVLLALSGVHVFLPHLVHELLALPPLFRLLVPTLAIIPFSAFMQQGNRGWRWAAEAEAKAPELVARGPIYAIVTLLVVVGILFWSISTRHP
jgi:hypothetical protein